MALELASGAVGIVGKGLGAAKDAVVSTAEVVGGAVQGAGSVAGAGMDAAGDLGGRIGQAFNSRRAGAQSMNLNLKVAPPEWLLYACSAAGVVGFLAKFGRVICCCYWPLECCGAVFARRFNCLRRYICPCMNDFNFLTVSIDRVVVNQALRVVGGRHTRPRALEVSVRFGQVWPLGSFSVGHTVESGSLKQPQELEPQRLHGGKVFFQIRCDDLPKGRTIFSRDKAAKEDGSDLQWVARRWFHPKSGAVPSGWWLKEVQALQQGTWKRHLPAEDDATGGTDTPRPTRSEQDPNRSLAKLSTIEGSDTVMKLQFEGLQEGAAEWPVTTDQDVGFGSRAEDAMTLEYWGKEEDLVLVVHVFIQKSSLEQAEANQKIDTGGNSLLQRMQKTASTIAGAMEDALEDAVDGLADRLREVRFIGGMMPEDPDDAFELSRCCLIEIFPHHFEKGPFHLSFVGATHLLHAHVEVSVTRLLEASVVHLRRLRVEVARGRGPLRGQVKAAGFILPRDALLKPGHAQFLDPAQDTSRVDVFHGAISRSRLQFTLPLRPGDVDLWLTLAPKLSFLDRATKVLGHAPLVGASLSRMVKWVTGTERPPDELFTGEVHLQATPGPAGTNLTYAVRGSPPVFVEASDLSPPGSSKEHAVIPAPAVVESRCSYLVDFRLKMAAWRGRGEGNYVFPRFPDQYIVFAWGLFAIMVPCTILGMLGRCNPRCMLFSEDATIKGLCAKAKKKRDCSCEHVEQEIGTMFLVFASWHLLLILGVITRMCGCLSRTTTNRVAAFLYLLATFVVVFPALVPSQNNVISEFIVVWILGLFGTKGQGTVAAVTIILTPRVLFTLVQTKVAVTLAMMAGLVLVVVWQNISSLCDYLTKDKKREPDGSRYELAVPAHDAAGLGVAPEAAKARGLSGSLAGAVRKVANLGKAGDQEAGEATGRRFELVTREGASAWEDVDGIGYRSQIVEAVHESRAFLTMQEFQEAIRVLKVLGLERVSDSAYSTRRLFHELCCPPEGDADGQREDRAAQRAVILREEFSGVHEDENLAMCWGEERLDKHAFLQHWAVDRDTLQPAVRVFRKAMDELAITWERRSRANTSPTTPASGTRPSDVFKEVSGSVRRTLEAAGRLLEQPREQSHTQGASQEKEETEETGGALSAWVRLQQLGPAQELVTGWQRHTPVQDCKSFELKVELKGDDAILKRATLHVTLRLRYLNRDQGYMSAQLKCWETRFLDSWSTQSLLFRSVRSWPERVPLNQDRALGPFDEYSIMFSLVPDPGIRRGSERPGKWGKDFIEKLRHMQVGWELFAGGRRVPEPPASHPLPSSREGKIDALPLRYYYSVYDKWDPNSMRTAVPVAEASWDDEEDEYDPLADISHDAMRKESGTTAWWVLSPYKRLLTGLCAKYDRSPQNGLIAVDVMEMLMAHQDRAPSSLRVNSEVEFKESAKELLGEHGVPTFLRLFDKDRGWQAKMPVPLSETPTDAPGWALEFMELNRGRQQPWVAREGSDPIRWLLEAAQSPGGDQVTLSGRRRVFMDVHGQVHELFRSTGQLLAGAEAAEAEAEDRMSTMEINDMLRILREKRHRIASGQAPPAEAREAELKVTVRTKADLAKLNHALFGNAPDLVELSQDDAVVPCGGVELLSVESPQLTSEETDFKKFATAVDEKGGTELLPADVTLRVPHARMEQVPDDRRKLPMHLLVLARIHNFTLLRADADKALRIMTAKRHGVTAQRDALECLCFGSPQPMDIMCGSGHSLGLVQPYGALSSMLRGGRSTYECRGCLQNIRDSSHRYHCEDCNLTLCVECAERVDELKDELRNLWEVAEGISKEEQESCLREWVDGAFSIVDMVPTEKEVTAVVLALTRGRRDLEALLKTLLPVRQKMICPTCHGPEMTRKAYRYRLLAGRVRCCKCPNKIKHSETQFHCPKCSSSLCMDCRGKLSGPALSSPRDTREGKPPLPPPASPRGSTAEGRHPPAPGPRGMKDSSSAPGA